MKGKLYLHIGPPKTATTALQYVFQNGSQNNFFYGGVTQPRSKVLELSVQLHKLCVTKGRISEISIDIFRQSIVTILDSGINIIISEEMFLVDSGSISHQIKIMRLSQILDGFFPFIIICARNPVDGLASLYQEVYQTLPLSQKISYRLFLKGNQAKVFDYSSLLKELDKHGFMNVTILSFDRLVAGDLTYTDFFGADCDVDLRITVSKINSGRYSESKVYREFGPYVIRDIINLRCILSERLYNFLLKKPVMQQLASLPLTGKRIKHLDLPDAMKKNLLSGYAFALSQSEISDSSAKSIV